MIFCILTSHEYIWAYFFQIKVALPCTYSTVQYSTTTSVEVTIDNTDDDTKNATLCSKLILAHHSSQQKDVHVVLYKKRMMSRLPSLFNLFVICKFAFSLTPIRLIHTFQKSNNAPLTMSASDGSTSRPKKIVIAGAGVIGISTAYYLSKKENVESITLVDPTGSIAPAASGKAGGFLALDWNDYSSVGPLARRSFDLHSHLAEELGAEEIQYRRLTCASISVSKSSGRKPSGKKLQGVEWADDSSVLDKEDIGSEVLQPGVVVGVRPLGDERTIAQVHPKRLCDALWKAVQSNEKIQSKLIQGSVNEKDAVTYDNDGELVGAKLANGSIIDADAILFACGPWTKYASCMVGVKYHSVILPTSRVLTQSVFFDGFGDPEVYPRPDGTAYCCGFPDPAVVVTEFPGEEEVRENKIDEIVESVRNASGGESGVLGRDPEKRQSCYLPSTPDNLPLMGAIPGQTGCFVAAGHSCWGILMGPGTGEAMASLIADGEMSKHVDLRPFSPARFA